MAERSVFFDEWIRSLREHYKHVIRTNDKITEVSLTHVMTDIGFSEEELRQLYLEATMRSDELADGFTPDIEGVTSSFKVHPAECACPDCAPFDESGHDVDGQPLSMDKLQEIEAEKSDTVGKVFAVGTVETQGEEIEPIMEAVDVEQGMLDDAVELESDEIDEEQIESSFDGEDDSGDSPTQLSMF